MALTFKFMELRQVALRAQTRAAVGTHIQKYQIKTVLFTRNS